LHGIATFSIPPRSVLWNQLKTITTALLLATAFLNAGAAPVNGDPPLPGAEYHIYRGNTHAHTMFTASHGEQLTSGKKDNESESGLQVDANGVQRPAKGKVLKSDWQKYQGPPAEHYARAKTNGYDFYVTTDHSQEEPFAPSSPTNAAWLVTKHQATASTERDFVALAGYEHSENNGPGGKGHLNIINTAEYLNALAPGIDVPYLYRWLKTAKPNGDGPIVACFNHPGRNSYNDWAYRDPAINDIITLLEVINGNSRIHYEAFVRALDKGWKVSPVCGLDNHGFWGISHHASATFVLATNKSKAAVLDAMWHRRTYAAMDTSLDCRYTVNGQIMGSTLAPTNTFAFDIAISDSNENNARHKITKIDIVKDGGAVARAYWPDSPAFSVRWKPTLTDATNNFFFIRVWNAAGGDAAGAKPENPMAWLAPIWTER
jgi:hypothetical protein